MSIFLGAVSRNQKVFVFDVYNMENFHAGAKPKFVKKEKIRRANESSAYNYVRHKWSYEKTGKSYAIERVSK